MSERNVAMLRELIAAWNDREPAKGERLLDPEVEWEPASPAALERSTFRGVDEEFASHITVRDGRAARVKAYLSWSEALEAAGLGG